MFYIANNLLLLAWCIKATNQFKFKLHHVLLDDALEMNDLVNNKYSKNYHELSLNISINPYMYNGILMNLKSDLDLHQSSCETFEHILILVTNQKNITIGCTTYMTHFFQSPLHLTFLLPAYEAIKEFISLTFTPLRFSCSEYHTFLKQCPNNPKNCVPRHLFCDGKDNCGLNGDEQNCYYVNNDIPLEVNKYFSKHKNGYSTGIFRTKKRRQTSSEPEETVALLTLGLKGFFPQAVPNHIESIHDSINKIKSKNAGGNYQNIKQTKK
uniref:Uncharacterized protein n=1 Tax=Strongyloides stercoralis TaxID=6248 RepID=A0AAF5D1N1_STRER